ncbi:helix-turn-helix transcriptional regulator [Nocardioides gilvus]|uniref:helix-turn-helix transcriptional regulator n=1 Tax=Nocardioides gilvus TaxID=1735589 RepID=UPI000D742A80|nr:WYL domain-containing protein [Nocardioides gilvus]
MSRAGTGSRDQVARLLALVPLLHRREGLKVAEAAAALGTTRAQVVKDLRVLLMCGLPGGMPDDLIDVDLDTLEEDGSEGVIHVSNAEYLARPVRLSATEATALIVALRAVRDSSSLDSREVVDRVIAKLEIAAAEGSVHQQIEITPEESVAARTRTDLDTAVARGTQVRISYFVPSRDEVSDRTVDPVQVATVDGVDYLEAWCHSAEDRRVFRLDRIQALELLDTPATTPPGAADEPLSIHLFTASEDSAEVTLLLAPGARWVPEYYPVDHVRHLDGGFTQVTLRVIDVRWLHQLVLRLAPDVTVVAPESVSTEVLRIASETKNFYG